ncbi:MAG: PIN domain-containing protein [Steroidobacteraceae bacterium]
MSGKIFVDTNVFVYVHDSGHPAKSRTAGEVLSRLWHEQSGRTSFQVLNELYVTLTRKLGRKVSPDQAWDVVDMLLAWDPQPIDRELLVRGKQIEQRYRLSWWDSLIVGAAQLQDCDVLFSEDLQAGMAFDSVTVVNPFHIAVKDLEATYAPPQRLPSRHRSRGRPRKVLRERV